MKNIYLLFLLCLFTQCVSEKTTETTLLEKTILMDSTMVNGFNIGDSFESIKNSQIDIIISSSAELLSTSQTIATSEDSLILKTSYWFSNNTMYHSKMELKPLLKKTSISFESVRNHLNTIYGSSTSNKGYSSWYFMRSNKEVEISLIDESSDYDYTLISISFSTEKPKLY